MHKSLLCAALLGACATPAVVGQPAVQTPPLEIRAGKAVPPLPGERYFRNVRQLTFGGENAEAYWSPDGTRLIFQSRRPPYQCDQIFILDLRTGEERLVSTGKGRTTCAYFLQDGRILYSSTHLASDECPPPVMRVRGRYVWPIYGSYDVFTAAPDGSDLVRVTETDGYDAEATVCPVTGRIVFTSLRDGDLELYSMEPDGSDVTRLTDRPGYDGGAFYSHDGKRLVLRSQVFPDDAALQEYREFLGKGLVVPTAMEITVIDRDGSNYRQLTDNGKANFAPYWHPDDRRILFSSNLHDPQGRDFDIYMIDADGTNQVRVTENPTFDGFPMFSPCGRYIAFASNRNGKERGETNVFVAEWVEGGS